MSRIIHAKNNGESNAADKIHWNTAPNEHVRTKLGLSPSFRIGFKSVAAPLLRISTQGRVHSSVKPHVPGKFSADIGLDFAFYRKRRPGWLPQFSSARDSINCDTFGFARNKRQIRYCPNPSSQLSANREQASGACTA